MLLNKNNLSIVRFVSDDDSKTALQHLHVTPDYTEACDGFTLVRVSIDKNLKDEDFPSLKPFTISKVQAPEVLLYPDAVRRALDSLPERSYLPILTNALLDAPESNVTAILYTKDTNTIHANASEPQFDKYPKTENAIPTDEPVLHVRFNAKKLIAILEILKECCDYNVHGGVDLLFHDSSFGEKQLVVKAKTEMGQNIYAQLMPIKMEDEEREDGESTP